MKLINMRQLTDKLGVDRSTIYRYIQQRKLPPASERRNNTALWNEAAVEASIKNHRLRVAVAA